MTRSIERRDFLAELGALAYLTTGAPNVWRISSTARIQSDPFTLGVASGDPTATGAVIWTRLAPQPLEPDGGMSGQRINVDWQVAEDEQFGRIVQRGRVAAVPELGFSLHVDVSGLQGDRWYCYRFMIGNGASPVGRLRTAPAAGAQAAMTMAFVSCQHWEQGLYTAYDHLSKEDRLDLVAHLGDYIYEYGPIEGRTRRYASTEVRTLDQYRARYAQTKSDAFLRAAHARAPWIVTWDDHEVDNNYANLVGENVMESEEQMRLRRAAGYQAWWEHMPVRVPRARNWADLNITKRLDWGALASFHVLDTRQYRSDQPCADGIKDTPCGEWGNAAHTLLGAEQERWLDAGLSGSPAGWQVLAQQIRVAPYDEKPGAGERYSMDQWSGYPAAIGRLMASINQRARNRTVVITGDIHSNWVNELRTRYDRPGMPVIGAEFVGTSISSGGDGTDEFDNWNETRVGNPFCKWHNNRRGYVMNAIGADEWKASYRVVPFVTRPGAPVQTAAEFITRKGRPGIEKV